jgi:hypothetical protein
MTLDQGELRHKWIEVRAHELWHKAGRPPGRDLAFWMAAEEEHDRYWKGQLCVLSPDQCPFQVEQPTTGGGHVAMCTRPDDAHCWYRAIQQKKLQNVRDLTNQINIATGVGDDKTALDLAHRLLDALQGTIS